MQNLELFLLGVVSFLDVKESYLIVEGCEVLVWRELKGNWRLWDVVRVLLSTGSVEVVVDLWVVAGELVNYSQDSQWVAF